MLGANVKVGVASISTCCTWMDAKPEEDTALASEATKSTAKLCELMLEAMLLTSLLLTFELFAETTSGVTEKLTASSPCSGRLCSHLCSHLCSRLPSGTLVWPSLATTPSTETREMSLMLRAPAILEAMAPVCRAAAAQASSQAKLSKPATPIATWLLTLGGGMIRPGTSTLESSVMLPASSRVTSKRLGLGVAAGVSSPNVKNSSPMLCRRALSSATIASEGLAPAMQVASAGAGGMTAWKLPSQRRT
mmetsp:Transcript_35446/g.63995  ORF Transcript_35446/g.63995 Transcript_35446/m.63995 type:complete len:249 (-) Transcript_35446:4454-5200(-)